MRPARSSRSVLWGGERHGQIRALDGIRPVNNKLDPPNTIFDPDMPKPELQEVFKTGGVPTYTFVPPKEYAQLILNLRTPGRGLVVEGPSGIGKTTAVERALLETGLAQNVTKLSARRPEDIEYIESLPELGSDVGTVIVDDFHKLPKLTQTRLADYLKTIADREERDVKLIVVGINNAGDNLIRVAADLVNRMDVIPFESNPDESVVRLVELGEQALNVDINVRDEVVAAAAGSFYLAQMLCREICLKANILEAAATKTTVEVSFEAVNADVWERLDRSFGERCKRFCRGSKMKKAGRAPYLHILRWLAQSTDWSISIRESLRQHPNMSGSVGQVVTKGYLDEVITTDDEIDAVIHFDPMSTELTVEDPQFLYYIRNIPWSSFAEEVGFTAVEFEHRYDFALSFAGSDRAVAEALFNGLQEAELEVFYDKNEQHRILASDVEDYLRPIYQTEAQFVIALLGPDYPQRVWTKFESEQFKARFGEGAVIPIWFDDATPGIFDESRRYGGYTFRRAGLMADQVTEIVQLCMEKIETARHAK